jgi:hypothetical protein
MCGNDGHRGARSSFGVLSALVLPRGNEVGSGEGVSLNQLMYVDEHREVHFERVVDRLFDVEPFPLKRVQSAVELIFLTFPLTPVLAHPPKHLPRIPTCLG